MFERRWKILGGVALALGIQAVTAGEAWLLIASDSPGSVVSVDDIYRGTTPQRPADALRIQVPEGTRRVEVRKRVNGKECAARQPVEVTGASENFVRFSPCKKTAATTTTSTAPVAQERKSWFGTVVPSGELEVPGRNF